MRRNVAKQARCEFAQEARGHPVAAKMFLITYKKRFTYAVQSNPRWAADKLREYLVRELESNGAWRIVVDDKHIRFTVVWWSLFKASWGSFNIDANGLVTIGLHNSQLKVTYQINFVRYYLGTFILMLVALIPAQSVWASTSFLNAVIFFISVSCVLALLTVWKVASFVSLFRQSMEDRLRKFFNYAARFGIDGELIASR
jgi:hypothetical protein